MCIRDSVYSEDEADDFRESRPAGKTATPSPYTEAEEKEMFEAEAKHRVKELF